MKGLYNGTDRLSTRISKFVCLAGIENSSGLWYTVHCKRCKIDKVGVSMQPKELEQWIGTQYGVSAEYPWAVSPENAVFSSSRKQEVVALLLRVAGDKLGCPGTAPVWILNIKCDPLMIGSLCSMEGIYPAYHMNKNPLDLHCDGRPCAACAGAGFVGPKLCFPLLLRQDAKRR